MKEFQKPSDVKVLYLGTPKIATKPLIGLIENGFNVVGVVTQEDKAIGRNEKTMEQPPVKKVASKAGIPVFQPHRIKKDFSFAEKLKFDVIVCMAYGQIIPMELINMAPKKAINLHGSLLPKLRGAAPIQRAIMNGDTETGITLMEMVEKMDAGRSFDKRILSIEETDSYTSLNDKLGDLAKETIVLDLLPYVNDELIGIPQKEEEVTFANKILPEDEHLPLTLSALEMNRYIRGLANEPGAYIIFRDKKLKIYSSSLSDLKIGAGVLKVCKGKLYLGANDYSLLLGDIRLEGKNRMPASSFANGAHIDKDGEKVY